MPDTEGSPKGLGPGVDQGRRKLLRAGLGLAGTALALDVMAAAKPATAALEAATRFSNSGNQNATGAQIIGKEASQTAFPGEPLRPTEAQGQAAASIDGPLAQAGTDAPKIGDFSANDGLLWLEQHWQQVVEVSVPVATVAAIATVVRSRVASSRAMESSFQHALTLLANADTESKVAAATELLYLLSDSGSEKYLQRIFATAVDHFRQRSVNNVVQEATIADYKFVPVLVFAASAIRDTVQRKGAKGGIAQEEHLNASHIHLNSLSLRDADLSYVNLQQATFDGTVLTSASFAYANLTGADLSRATLNGADLSHAILFGTRLTGARARSANLSHALLRNANLVNTDLSYASLGEAELREGTNFEGANIYRATGLTGELRNRYLAMGAIERDWG